MTTTYLETTDLQATEPHPWRWTAEEYHRIAETGLFQDRRVELIEGEIIEISPMNAAHWTAVVLVSQALRGVFKEGYLVTDQLPISLLETSEPQPDLAVIKGEVRDFKIAIPKTAALVVEISDSTLQYDLNRKARLYARAGIGEYWILDVNARHLIVHRAPMEGVYSDIQTLDEKATVTPLASPEAKIAVADLLA